MKFHGLHGSSVTLSEGKTVATRSDAHFCNGIVFSDQAIRVGQHVCIELSCIQSWSGALHIGLTVQDPSKLAINELPSYSVPYFSKKDGYWIRPISENMVVDRCQVMFYINIDGHVPYFVNNEHKGTLLVGLPADKAFWVLFDIYGNTNGIKLVKSDIAPKEITARGPDAMKAFESACMSGVQPVHRTRLMLVGQDGAGKTSLKKALLGQKREREETETCGIDSTASCTFCVGCHDNWTVCGKDVAGEEISNDVQSSFMTDIAELEEEYNKALATHIVQELMFQKCHNKTSSSQKAKPASLKESQRSLSSGVKKFPSKPSSATTNAKFSEIPAEMLKEVPEAVVEIVQKMLDSSAEVKSQESVSRVTKPPTKVVLNIWDFAGKEVYYTTHQVFLSRRALYVIVFNLTHDLEEATSSPEDDADSLSTLDYMDFWMRTIFAHVSTNFKQRPDSCTFSPPILVVGTHKDCLHSDPELINKAVLEKFAQIEQFLLGKPYVQHLVTPFFAVNNTLDDASLNELKQKVEEVFTNESYFDEKMPIRWIKFEQEIAKLTWQGSNYASYNQMTEIAGDLGIIDYNELMTMLEFYHDLGIIIFFGSGKTVVDNLLNNTVILKPQWLIDMFKYVISSSWKPEDKWNLVHDKWTQLQDQGILDESLLDTLWQEARDQKVILLGLLEKFDLVCQCLPTLAMSHDTDLISNKMYYVPARFGRFTGNNKLFTVGDNDVTFYIIFHGFLPYGLFHRILTRTTRWSQDTGGKNPYFLYKQVGRFFLNVEHDFVLEMDEKKYSRIKVVILRVSESSTEQDQGSNNKMSPPKPDICAKVRNFLESTLSELREMWMKRISSSINVQCPCDRICEIHKKEGCSDKTCIHFLNLDECLTNKIVLCDYRRIKTTFIKKCFPEPLSLGFNGPVLPQVSLVDTCGNIEKQCPTLPGWIKSAAKLLNNAEHGKDWNALAKELGYKHNQRNKFSDDLNPSLVLLADWIISSGNTGLSLDMLTLYLEKLDREDVVDIIQKAQESEQAQAQIFISYQWDSQDEVKLLRNHLERSGLTCWMDIGQIGGGDQLYYKIDEAIRRCKAVIACISPKYVVSQHCMKELSLADLLCKPIIPVMVEKTIWPPPGGMALIFSQLVYINMKGVGGHGGTGIHADKKDKYREIIQRLSLYATPDLSHCLDIDNDCKQQYIDEETSSSNSLLNIPDRFSMHNSLTFVTARNNPVEVFREPAYQPVEEVRIHQCKICIIL